MPLDNVLYLCFVVGAFAVFAAALAYGEWTTRHAVPFVSASANSAKAQPQAHRTRRAVHEMADA